MKKAYNDNPLSHISLKNIEGDLDEDIDINKLLNSHNLNKEIMRFYYMLC